jgi:hypothetical protein
MAIEDQVDLPLKAIEAGIIFGLSLLALVGGGIECIFDADHRLLSGPLTLAGLVGIIISSPTVFPESHG